MVTGNSPKIIQDAPYGIPELKKNCLNFYRFPLYISTSDMNDTINVFYV